MTASGLPVPRTARWLIAAVLAVLTLFYLIGGGASSARGGSATHHGVGGTMSVLGGGISSVLGGRGEPINHVVLLEFKQHATPMAISRATSEMLELQLLCTHPLTRKPYIKGIKGGRDHSPEGLQKGITHAFIFEFASAEDRNYYIEEDPVHKEFQQRLKPVLQNVIVIDFTGGKFI